MSLGNVVPVTEGKIGATGGTIAIEQAYSPLSGMRIVVPDGAVTEETAFTVSYAPIMSHELPADVVVLSPMIHINNGGKYAAEAITVVAPVEIPEGHHAGAFYRDPVTGELEAIPVLMQDESSITIATYHFSDFFLSAVADYVLHNLDILTGFQPGRDDWQIPNYGSTITPTGNCTGMCLSALYYFMELKQGAGGPLWQRYDNNLGASRKTEDFWPDDDSALRLVSMVQYHVENTVSKSKLNDDLLENDLTTPKGNFYAIANALLMTNKPQFIGVISTAAKSGHALICYGISKQTLYVADPNFPGDTKRTITFNGSNFTPYTSGDRRTNLREYDRIVLYGKTGVYNWQRVGEFWRDFDAGDIGEGKFPDYAIRIVELDNAGTVMADYEADLLNDNYVSWPLVRIEIDRKDDPHIIKPLVVRFDDRLKSPGDASNPLIPDIPGETRQPKFVDAPLELKPGNNWIGVYATKDQLNWFSSWAGFDWINLVYEKDLSMGDCTEADVVGRWRRYYDSDCDGTAEYADDDDDLWILNADQTVSHPLFGVLEGEGWSVGDDNVVYFWFPPTLGFSMQARLTDDCSRLSEGVMGAGRVTTGPFGSVRCWYALPE